MTDITKTIRFKLTLIYSLVLFIFSAGLILTINVYSYQYFNNDPVPIGNVFMPNHRPSMIKDLAQEERDRIREIRLNDLKQLQTISFLSLFPITALSFGLGYYISGRFLQPIDDLRKKIDKLKAQNLGKKLDKSADDEIGQLIDSFNEMSERLEKAFSNQVQFVQNASHELRTPLAVIHTNLDVVLDSENVSKGELKTAIKNALKGIKRLTKLSEDLLELTAPGGKSNEEVNLVSLIESSVNEMQSIAKDSNKAIIFKTDYKKVFYKINKIRLSRAINNLIENAIRYSKDESIEVILNERSKEIIVTVVNYGSEISKKHLEKIFDRFYKVDSSRKNSDNSFGLGLALTKQIIEEYGGRIKAESENNKTSFTITLPK